MKLIFCLNCCDIVLLVTHRIRWCRCGLSGGYYTSEKTDGCNNHAEYFGLAKPIGINNKEFFKALKESAEDNSKPVKFDAFSFEKCDHFKKNPTLDMYKLSKEFKKNDP